MSNTDNTDNTNNTIMSKKDDMLRGGLKALFGDDPKEEDNLKGVEDTTSSEQPSAPMDEEASAEQPQERKNIPDGKALLSTIEDAELKEALRKRRARSVGRPRKHSNVQSMQEGYQRITNIVNIEKMDKLREIALRETLTIKEILEAAMDIAIDRYESKHGEIKISKKKNPKNVFK